MSRFRTLAKIAFTFGRRSIRAGCVARRLNTAKYSDSSRLASAAPPRKTVGATAPSMAFGAFELLDHLDHGGATSAAALMTGESKDHGENHLELETMAPPGFHPLGCCCAPRTPSDGFVPTRVDASAAGDAQPLPPGARGPRVRDLRCLASLRLSSEQLLSADGSDARSGVARLEARRRAHLGGEARHT
jgi:hypothetical protein